jgi:hypothetical protein
VWWVLYDDDGGGGERKRAMGFCFSLEKQYIDRMSNKSKMQKACMNTENKNKIR